MPHLRVKTGPNKGKIYEVASEVITIGRDESQTIQVLDQGVSRQHAEIFSIGEMVFVRDLNSTNGTYVNNQAVTEEALIRIDLPTDASITVSILDVSGRHVQTIHEGRFSAGTHQLTWDGRYHDGSRAPSGVYLCVMKTGSQLEKRRLVVLR